MNRVLIINPGTIHRYLHEAEGVLDQLFAAFIRACYDRRFRCPPHGRCTSVPSVTLMNLRHLFRDRGWQTIVVDEQVEEIDFSTPADLVCVTAVTAQYERAAWIGERFRKRGVPTVLGGVHASCLPGECRSDFDAVCVGEAEAYIDRMLADLSTGRLAPLYRADRLVDMVEVPFLPYDLDVGRSIPFHAVSFSRGCNHGCDFCSIRMALGRHRTRSVESVVQHISEVGARHVWFHDANLTADRDKARALFKALVPLKFSWMSSVPLDACLDEEMVDLMAASGCWLLSLGFETLSRAGLESSGKSQNRVSEYVEIIERLHKRRIAIEGNFVFGFDSDTPAVFDETAAFVIRTGIDIPNFFVLTPYPNTPLYRRLDAQGRIADRDWSHYENVHFVHLPVFEPTGMTREQLRDGCRRADRIVYSRRGTIRRLWNAGLPRPSVLIANYVNMQRMARQRHLLPHIGVESVPKLKDPLAVDADSEDRDVNRPHPHRRLPL